MGIEDHFGSRVAMLPEAFAGKSIGSDPVGRVGYRECAPKRAMRTGHHDQIAANRCPLRVGDFKEPDGPGCR